MFAIFKLGPCFNFRENRTNRLVESSCLEQKLTLDASLHKKNTRNKRSSRNGASNLFPGCGFFLPRIRVFRASVDFSRPDRELFPPQMSFLPHRVFIYLHVLFRLARFFFPASILFFLSWFRVFCCLVAVFFSHREEVFPASGERKKERQETNRKRSGAKSFLRLDTVFLPSPKNAQPTNKQTNKETNQPSNKKIQRTNEAAS